MRSTPICKNIISEVSIVFLRYVMISSQNISGSIDLALCIFWFNESHKKSPQLAIYRCKDSNSAC